MLQQKTTKLVEGWISRQLYKRTKEANLVGRLEQLVTAVAARQCRDVIQCEGPLWSGKAEPCIFLSVQWISVVSVAVSMLVISCLWCSMLVQVRHYNHGSISHLWLRTPNASIFIIDSYQE